MNGRIAHFDMDGTLFDYDGAMLRDLKALAAPDETLGLDHMARFSGFQGLEKYPHMKARMDMIKKVPGWWRDLPKYQPGWDVYEVAKRIGFCCKILTKGPWTKSHAWAEKHECIHKHFGDDVDVTMVSGQEDKGNVYGRVLVEDHPPYIRSWLQHRKRGLVILIDQPYNKGFEYENVVRYRGDNLEEVTKLLQAAYDRESKQHWKELVA